MSLNLDHLRPAAAYRIASGVFAVFFIAGACGVAFSVRYATHEFGKPNGLPIVIEASNVIFPLIGAVVAFSTAARFGRYARKIHLQRRGSF